MRLRTCKTMYRYLHNTEIFMYMCSEHIHYVKNGITAIYTKTISHGQKSRKNVHNCVRLLVICTSLPSYCKICCWSVEDDSTDLCWWVFKLTRSVEILVDFSPSVRNWRSTWVSSEVISSDLSLRGDGDIGTSGS